jgi:hypothetical protein
MKRTEENKQSDIEECKEKIERLLKEYNCGIISQDGWHGCLIEDRDTQETLIIK